MEKEKTTQSTPRGNIIQVAVWAIKRELSLRRQRTFCWCPICKEDLCSNNSFIEDTDLVRYECSNCGCLSSWDFDAPSPILIKHSEISYNNKI